MRSIGWSIDRPRRAHGRRDAQRHRHLPATPVGEPAEPGGDVAQLSTERLDRLEVDRLVFLIDPGDQTGAQVRANPLFTRLRVARENRALFLPFSPAPSSGAALAFNSVLSIPYGLQQVVPALAR